MKRNFILLTTLSLLIMNASMIMNVFESEQKYQNCVLFLLALLYFLFNISLLLYKITICMYVLPRKENYIFLNLSIMKGLILLSSILYMYLESALTYDYTMFGLALIVVSIVQTTIFQFIFKKQGKLY